MAIAQAYWVLGYGRWVLGFEKPIISTYRTFNVHKLRFKNLKLTKNIEFSN